MDAAKPEGRDDRGQVLGLHIGGVIGCREQIVVRIVIATTIRDDTEVRLQCGNLGHPGSVVSLSS